MEEWIKFVCQSCGAKVKTPVENVGKKGRCYQCKTECVIPEKEIKIEDDGAEAFIDDLMRDLEEIDKQAEIKSKSQAQILESQKVTSGLIGLDDPI